MRNKDVDVFAEAKLTPEQREIFETLRRIVEETVPTAHEVISGGSPAWQGHRILATVSATPTHLTVLFERGASFTDEHWLLEGTGFNTRHLKLTSADDLQADAIRDYLGQAAALDNPPARD